MRYLLPVQCTQQYLFPLSMYLYRVSCHAKPVTVSTHLEAKKWNTKFGSTRGLVSRKSRQSDDKRGRGANDGTVWVRTLGRVSMGPCLEMPPSSRRGAKPAPPSIRGRLGRSLVALRDRRAWHWLQQTRSWRRKCAANWERMEACGDRLSARLVV
ncbi:hypothetical protein OH76DRAFT_237928 [Lentinus brumalis]|uniref:Uncharacterized protein n=1 Tax=Lentinus brumalis TaxID=2498619 RepID=A0A371DHL2_9APHY|nr:hypothetical protein OH76DRAFT_237928 [Polyporus brumalis]